MGWVYTSRPQGLSHKEFFSTHMDGVDRRILAASSRGFDLVYFAYEINAVSGIRSRAVICFGARTNWVPNDARYNFGYNDLGESDLPPDCPEKILKLLTAPETYYTDPQSLARVATWRQACWDNIKRRKSRHPLAKDAIVIIPNGANFNGEILHALKVNVPPPRLEFVRPSQNVNHARRYRLRRYTLDNALVFPPGTDWVTVLQSMQIGSPQLTLALSARAQDAEIHHSTP
ncbi:MAG: hypothetical protein JXB38_02675 [Anaerolineales bacterium]|nr:hypothetical protein [Anaerolineales bacterium]